MTTRKFSAIKLPHPEYTLNIGQFDLKDENLNLPKWIPRFSNQVQLLEVCQSIVQSTGYDINRIVGKFIIIENARPELFLRRDFISKFVNMGTVHISHDYTSDCYGPESYQICTKDNTLSLVLGEKLYRRFGLIGKKVLNKVKKSRCKRKEYKIDIDLKDLKIMENNKYQDKLVQTFRRLNPINKLYFRFVPNELTAAATTITEAEATAATNDASIKSLEFFRYVINEYAIDGFQPVPLTGCHEVGHKLERKWTNFDQRHPKLDLNFMAQGNVGKSSNQMMNNSTHGDVKRRKVDVVEEEEDEANSRNCGIQRNPEILSKVVDIIDWLGYQLLSLDCNREEICCRYPDGERFDVSCTQISGLMDFRQIQENLGKIFGHDVDDDDCDNRNQQISSKSNTVLRAMILYNNRQDISDSGVVLLQDVRANHKDLITVIGL